MDISGVKVKLLGSDILSIINEFIKIEGLSIKNVSIDDGIILEGNLKKGLNIKFFVKIQLIECINNKIVARIVKVKILNLGMFRILRSFVLNQLSKMFEKYGISNDKDKVIIDINTLLKDISFVDLNINEIYMKKSEVWVEASSIRISLAGNLIKSIETKETLENEEENLSELESVNKVHDNYSEGRKILENKLPEKSKKYKEYIFMLPDIASLVYRLLKDKRVPIKTKLVMSIAITYITVPINIIPNNIPFIGVIDDVGVAFFAVNKIIKDVPLPIIVENWQGENDLLLVLKKGIEYLINFTGAKNVEKLYGVIEDLSTL
ncbi:DUF1232 domain-containing protein [Clostridium chromiireducens]|uniref:DUF1232 domain-containing protein n=1 Tax=Clostridium chromiireducens TaxID=225345 RepID=A0A964RQQ8_9CLOT|nr:DUF1232 domain-containing protein [Clostridium chromiireducens]MVX66224.1 DUF1232 domain-containing protein [Clostridium chromiireducens]